MITTSKTANPNYLAKIVKLQNLQKHSNADKLQVANIDFQTVITGLDAQNGDIYVYFPLECALNKDFLSQTNSFRDKTLNSNPNEVGFFEEHGRIKAIKLRGEKSMGYVVPVSVVEEFAKVKGLSDLVGQEFDTVNGILLLTKYVPKNSQTQGSGKDKQGKKPKLSRLIEGQVNLHIDTENLRKNVHKVKPDDVISLTYKTHGTSWWVSNILVKRPLKWYERLAAKLGIKVQDTEYDYIYGSRRVVKNSNMEDPKAKDHFYGYDIWEDIKNQIKDSIPEGFTLYGECLGFDKNGKAIQAGYDYSCAPGQFKLEVYRITQTNANGFITELTYPQIQEFCTRANLTPSHVFYTGKAIDLYPDLKSVLGGDDRDVQDWREHFLRRLEADYNEKDCFMCVNKVPEEGVVLRVESLTSCDSYKLKSFKFLKWESDELDKGEIDIESDN